MSNKVVKAALVIAKREDGSDVYIYQGGVLPDGLAEGEEKRLAEFLDDPKNVTPGSGDAVADRAAAVEAQQSASRKSNK